MQKAQEIINKEPESVTIEGLQFYKYQMDWIEICAKLEGQTPIEFIHDTFLDAFSLHLENLLPEYIMEITKRIRSELGS